ncbi:bifunctional aspartate kinase/homoserine dehydrogenase I [Thiotrichales bacterium 19S3-7]|nr:bifunctional aspartate kinase/homoserine dehydrogenase I [Thiotrichales bacterium 19S3-7]MCF6802519.1 bifunctional aspartate kinase/homoserine dehydrogenase I [Thiotrichales bacterium 19S3-11]
MRIVHKFGGSSLKNEGKIKNVVNLIDGKNEAIVVSAIGKTTQNLTHCIEVAIGSKTYVKLLNNIKKQHLDIIEKIAPRAKKKLTKVLENDIENITYLLTTIHLTKLYSEKIKNYILGFGEIWSAQILTSVLIEEKIQAKYISADDILRVDDSRKPVLIDWQKSNDSFNRVIDPKYDGIYVITGFIASNLENQRTVLGMNCSDYSASIFAKLFHVERLIIWTDVAGVYSANPAIVPTAKLIRHLSYKEALELAYFGASVVHPLTIGPMMDENIPIFIKSSQRPNGSGTEISNKISPENHALIKGLTGVDQVSLIRVQGAGLIGVSGIAAKIFSILHEGNISVMMISQASSEYSICFAVDISEGDQAVRLLEKAFEIEIDRGVIEHIHNDKHYSLVTAVGDGMKDVPGAVAKMINPLSKAGINIHAIAQGSSQRSITLTIKESRERAALNLIHQEYIDDIEVVAIAIIGTGNIATALIEEVKQSDKQLAKLGIKLKLVALCNSKKMLFTTDDFIHENWQKKLSQGTQKMNLDTLADFLGELRMKYRVLIDATASIEIASSYIAFFKRKISVITPNKYANTQSMEYYYALRSTAIKHKVQFRYETNVCAGLPLIKPIQEMIYTGDKVECIKGVFSGTLSYLFNELNQGVSFSKAVINAYELGYTEPDPREDLSGMDVARKIVILAREIGFSVDVDNLEIQNLTPPELAGCSKEKFFKLLPKYDSQMEQLFNQLKGDALGLHYVGEINIEGRISVKIQSYDHSSVFSRVQGTDNLVIIRSSRYHDYPLIVQGPGAGAAVTAAGVFADILQVVK